jgi:hypothetical protein
VPSEHTLSIDASLPAECDDEHWDLDTERPAQPADKPALVTFLVWKLKLTQILLFALRTIVRSRLGLLGYELTLLLQYGTKKSKAFLGYYGDDWEQKIVSELDSALNHWVDSVPEHCTPVFHSAVVCTFTIRSSAVEPKSGVQHVF